MRHGMVTDAVISCFYSVYNCLGYGFLEKVYQNAMLHELNKRGTPVTVLYDGIAVGDYYADILVDNNIIVELKATKTLLPEHEAQLLNYLKATHVEVGLLLNFGSKPEIKRKVLDNVRK